MNKFEIARVVPAHAAFQAGVTEVPEDFRESRPWVLLDYQRNGGYGSRGEQTLYIEHLENGLRDTAEDPTSVLILYGGHTREEAGNGNQGWSEGASYFGAALKLVDELGLTSTGVVERTLVEEGAADSFQNLQLSATLFERVMGYPAEEIHVYGFGFKDDRYQHHHEVLSHDSATARFPRLVYVEVNNPQGEADLAAAMRGEARTRRDFQMHPHGDGGDLLAKRQARSFPGRQSPYPQEATVANFLANHGTPPSPQPRPILRTPVLSGVR